MNVIPFRRLDTVSIEKDFGLWSVVHRRNGKFRKRDHCASRDIAEDLAKHLVATTGAVRLPGEPRA
jgi:hypothetical protein